MSEWDPFISFGIDAPPAVAMRAHWSSTAAGLPPQYDTAVALLRQASGPELQTIMDIGCNSGNGIHKALGRAGLDSVMVNGLDILSETEATYFLRDNERPNFRYTQIKPDQSDLPLPANSIDGALGLNVLFRTDNAPAMLKKIWRVLRPEAPVVLSSNFKAHAMARHWIARAALQDCSTENAILASDLPAPAKRLYFNDLLALLQQLPEFEVVHKVEWHGTTPILPEDRELFLYTIQCEASRTDLHPSQYGLFRAAVEKCGNRFINTAYNSDQPFNDPVHSGMVVIKKAT